MNKKLIHAILALDLWVFIVSISVFISLYFLDGVIYLSAINIVVLSLLIFNLISFISLSLNNFKKLFKFKNKETKKSSLG